MEKTGCKIICGAPTTLAVKGLMLMIMMINCGLGIEDRKPIFSKDNLAHNDASPSLVVKGSTIQKISSGQTFIDILEFRCKFDLENKNPISP